MSRNYTIADEDLSYILEASQDALTGLAGAHLFLTGCSGFLGKWIVEGLLWSNEKLHLQLQISVLTRSAQRLYEAMPQWQHHANIHLVEGDVTALTSESVTGITHIVHGANHTNDGSADWALEHMDTAHEGTRAVLQLARAQRVKHMLLLSSGAVYGMRQNGVTAPFVEQEEGPEDYLREPNVYAVCKYFEEMYTAAYGKKYGIRIPIARLFTFAGKHMPLHARQALSSFLSDVMHDRDIVIQGDGTAIRSYMHAADMVVWVLALLERGEHGTPYNVGSDEAISVAELAHKVVKDAGKNLKISILGKNVAGNAPSVYVPCVQRIKKYCALPDGKNIHMFGSEYA